MADYIDHGKIGGTAAMVISHGTLYDRTVVTLWEEITGRRNKINLDDKLAVQLGKFTEPFNIEWFKKTSKYGVDGNAAPGQIYTHANGYSIAQIDALAFDENDVHGVFEAKHTGQHKKMEDMLDLYYPQYQHYMAVMDLPWAIMSVIFGNSRHQYRRINRNQEYIDELMAREDAFWKCVIMDVAPKIPEQVKQPKLTKVVSMEKSNEWGYLAQDWLDNQEASVKFDAAKEGLKELMPADAGEAFGHGIKMKKDARGGKRIWHLETPES